MAGHVHIPDFGGMGLPRYGGAPMEHFHWRPQWEL